ncbi:MAG: DNA-3-methyladenine glycosylase 2 family protein [Clostridiales bacterium]|nr:DNA-3-methyladenine glycosylase 2 family protein [Clostridiales bacterium]
MGGIAEIIGAGRLRVPDTAQFDPYAIMHSGQVFRYFPIESGYRVIAGKHFADIKKDGSAALIDCDDAEYFFNYFDFAADYNAVKRGLYEYRAIRPAIDAGGGIRILRAEFAETVISFIISANNNIKRFTKTLNLLAARYGEKLPCGDYSFPALSRLAALTEFDYASLGCGYRAAYLVKAVDRLLNLDEDALAALDNDALRRELLKIEGVGPKVCACVMLFCGRFHRLDTAPVDTWIAKALESLPQDDGRALTDHEYAGIAQQYVFYYLQHLHMNL